MVLQDPSMISRGYFYHCLQLGSIIMDQDYHNTNEIGNYYARDHREQSSKGL